MEVHLAHYGAKKQRGMKNYFRIHSEDLCSVQARNVPEFVLVVCEKSFFPLQVFWNLISFKADSDGLCPKVLLASSWRDVCGLFGWQPNCPDFAGYTSSSLHVWPRALGGVGLWGGLMRGCANKVSGIFFFKEHH